LGEHRFVLLSMFVLSGAVQGAISLEAVPVSFSSTRHLGRSPGVAVNSDQRGVRDPFGSRNHGMDDSSIE
jgi:hypothetical protein